MAVMNIATCEQTRPRPVSDLPDVTLASAGGSVVVGIQVITLGIISALTGTSHMRSFKHNRTTNYNMTYVLVK